MQDFDQFEADCALIEAMASALRDELGAAIEQQPGFDHPTQAGQVNRAFRIVVQTIVQRNCSSSEELDRRSNELLIKVARRHLHAVGFGTNEVKQLFTTHLGHREDWLAFLVLTSRSELSILLRELDADGP